MGDAVQQLQCVFPLPVPSHHAIGVQVNDWYFTQAGWQTVTDLFVVWLENAILKHVIWSLERKPFGLSNPGIPLIDSSQIRTLNIFAAGGQWCRPRDEIANPSWALQNPFIQSFVCRGGQITVTAWLSQAKIGQTGFPLDPPLCR